MRRGCLGCLGGSVLVVLALLAVGYFLIVQPAQRFLAGFGTPPAQTQSDQPRSDRMQDQTPGQGQSAPSSGSAASVGAPVSEAELREFVRVRRAVRAAVGDSFTGLESVFRDLQNGQTPDLMTVGRVLGGAADSLGRARQAQAAALAQQGLSLGRYDQIRRQVNEGLGLPSVNFAQVAASLQRGQLPDFSRDVRTADPRTRALVAPFREELLATAPLGLLGL